MQKITKAKTTSLTVLLVSVFLFVSATVCPCAQAAVGWSKTYGGTNAELGFFPHVLQTSDGGYVITCDTNSYGAGLSDFYLVKTDADGAMQWQKTYGGLLNESIFRFCATSDGGYAITGRTNSFGAGGNDTWLVKTAADGFMQWSKTYGGADDDGGFDVRQTADGGYALLGYTGSFGAGGRDVWLIKTDETGNMQWNRTFGGTGGDEGINLILTSDGGYALSSYTTSFGGWKSWLIRLNEFGYAVWNKTYAIGAASWTNTAIQTTDGGYALIGVTMTGGKGREACLVKTDSFGNMLWNKTYGGIGRDVGWGVVQMADDGYTIVGETDSFGAGDTDGWLIRTDVSGNMIWNKTYGGTGKEITYDTIRTADGGYAIVGYTDSFGAGSTDLWLIKTDEFGVIPEGLTIGVMLLLSTVGVIVGTRYFRKRAK